MPDISAAGNLLLVILGFGSLIFIHELGHFLAARWAGVRVHEFAIGFGPAICSWRKGFGFTAGSSEKQFAQKLKAAGHTFPNGDLPGVSATEYRLNWIPFGGYVRMLGQDDANPNATSTAPDSYAAKSVPKRMVIISAGVVMNLIAAAFLFIAVFMNGLRQPAAVIGFVAPNLPAANATPQENQGNIAPQPGLQTGDRVLSINNKSTPTFGYVQVATAMASPDSSLRFEIERTGFDTPLFFDVAPKKSDDVQRGMEIGIGIGISNTIGQPLKDQEDDFAQLLNAVGLQGVQPGDVLTSVNNNPASSFFDLHSAFETNNAKPVTTQFTRPDDEQISSYTLPPAPTFMLETSDDKPSINHLLGLTHPVVIQEMLDDSKNIDILQQGDILARVANIEWPTFQQLISELDQHAGSDIDIRVLRNNSYTTLQAHVSRQGTLGFRRLLMPTSPAIVAGTILDQTGATSPADTASFIPGSQILSANSITVTTFADLREALRTSTRPGQDATIYVTVRLPIGDTPDQAPMETLTWNIPAADVDALHALGWSSPVPPELFEPQTIILQAQNPVAALGQGLAETKRIITLSYLTLLRFVQGSVHIEQFKGPVGIAHIGTQIARDGLISLLFFLAVISTNLAVLNFLPLPIVDGGHMIYLLIEGITGKPVSVVIQNLAAMAGILVLASFFLLVTFNDIKALLGA